jgi:hypothetical protein
LSVSTTSTPERDASSTAALMALSGAVVYAWMEETHPEFGTHEPPEPPRRQSSSTETGE